jgi:hypothetical protein
MINSLATQKADRLAIDSERILELTRFEHRTLALVLAMAEAGGQGELVGRVLDGFRSGTGKTVLHYHSQFRRALGLD